MGAVGFLAWSGLARRLAPGLLLAALVALAGGVAMGALAGARRTDTAYDRLAEATNHPDLNVTPEGDSTLFDPSIVEGLAGVAASGAVHGFAAVRLTPQGTVDLATVGSLLAPADTTAFYELGRPVVLEGRLPHPEAADEITIHQVQRAAGFGVGSVVDLCLVDFGEVLAYGGGILEGTATPEQQRAFADQVCAVQEVRIVGIVGFGVEDVVLRESSEQDVFLVGSPALAAAPPRPRFFSFVLVDMEPGADLDAFVDAVLERAPPGAGVSVQASSLRATVVSRTIEPHVRALALFAAAAAIAAAGVLGPTIVRWAGTPQADRETLIGIGLRPGQLRMASALRGGALGVVAAAGALAIAVAVSDRFPIGIAAEIEPSPGVRIDPAVLGVGAVLIVALGAVLGGVAATRGRAGAGRPSRVAEALGAGGAPPAVAAGVRSVISGQGRGASALRTLAGVAVAIVAIVSALTFQAGLGRLLDTPARYGWTWDAVVDTMGDPLDPEVLAVLERDPSVRALSLGRRSALLRDGATVQVFAFDPVVGSAYPTLLEGRAPRGGAEIALGGQTLDRLDAALGDTLRFRGPNGEHLELTVVGRTLLPFLALGQDLSVAEGGLVDVDLLGDIGIDASLALVDLAPGSTRDDLAGALDEVDLPFPLDISGPTPTADLRGYDAVRRTPLLLAGVLALLGVGVLGHTVAAMARQRRHELGVLRCLGFVGRDLRRSVLWSSLTVAGLCLVVAVPLGIGLGRTLWGSFADRIGVVADPVTPAWPVAAVVLATIAAALALAVVPGHAAARVHPAEVLRGE